MISKAKFISSSANKINALYFPLVNLFGILTSGMGTTSFDRKKFFESSTEISQNKENVFLKNILLIVTCKKIIYNYGNIRGHHQSHPIDRYSAKYSLIGPMLHFDDCWTKFSKHLSLVRYLESDDHFD